MIQKPLLSIAIVFAITATCRPASDAPATTEVRRWDSAGIEIVDNPVPTESNRGPRLGLRPVTILAADDSSMEVNRGLFFPIHVNSDSSIVLFEGDMLRLSRVSPTGKLLGTVGGRGEGPGQVNSMPRVIVPLRADTILMVLPDTRRYSIYDAQLKPVLTRTLPINAFVETLILGGPGFEDGSVLDTEEDTARTRAWAELQEVCQGTFPDRRHVRRYDRDGRVLADYGKLLIKENQLSRSEAGHCMEDDFFQSRAAWGMAKDGTLYYAQGMTFEIRRFDPSGRLIRIIRMAMPERAVSDSDLIAEFGEGRGSFAELRRQFHIPSAKPWIEELRTDARGNLWVSEFAPRHLPGKRKWYVFDTSAAFSGVVEVDPRTTIGEIGADYLLTRRMVDDIPQVVVWPLEFRR